MSIRPPRTSIFPHLISASLNASLTARLTQTLSNSANTYLYGNGRIAQSQIVNQQPEIAYFLGDALGSVRQMTDASGALTLAKNYDPYGQAAQSLGAASSSYGYTGEYQTGGMVYLRARHYAPSMGRFLTRDTWEGDANRPMSFNRWNYVEANPINSVDPTGFYALALFSAGQEYGPVENVTWTSDERRLINRAVDAIADAYARAYNSYVLKNNPFILCLMKSSRMPIDIAYMLMNDRIDPTSAFLGVHDGKVTFSKHNHKYKEERVVYDDKGNPVFDKKTGKVKKVTVELDNFGLGPNKNSVYIFPNGEYSVAKYGRGDVSLSEENYIRFITHEMGHVFDHAIGEKGRGATDSKLASGGNNQNYNGFCGKYSTSGANGGGWQWRTEDAAWEYFADMFTGYVYNCWEADLTVPSGLSETGDLRSNFMNDHMPIWIYNKINGR